MAGQPKPSTFDRVEQGERSVIERFQQSIARLRDFDDAPVQSDFLLKRFNSSDKASPAKTMSQSNCSEIS